MKLKSLLIIGASSLFLASCLKSRDSLGLINDKGSIVTEIADVNVYGSEKPVALNATPSTETFTLITLKTFAGRSNQPAGGKVHVKLAVDNSLLPAGITALPTNAYTLSSLEFDVPASGQVAVPMTLNKTALDLSLTYGIGLKIASVNGGVISDLANNIAVEILVKNAYDGIYQVISGKVTRYTAPGVPAGDALSGNLAGNPDVAMITVGANTVMIPPSGYVGALYWAGGASQVAGIDGLKITVDPATNQTTAVSSGYATSNATLANWAGSTPSITYNRYDPATKTFYLAFKWNPTSNVREYEIVLKYKGPR